MIEFSGTHVFIVGGSRGIGAAAARQAAAAGAKVSVSYVKGQGAADRLVEEIKSLGGDAAAFQADVAVASEIQRAIAESVAHFGPLHGLVVSAGIFEGLPLEEMTLEFWNRMMAINLTGTFLAVQAGVKSMREAGKGGSIVIYTSTAGQRGSAVYSAYATSKGAQVLFMRSMAQELAPNRIRVNCIAPAWTETDMATSKIDAIGRAQVVGAFPLGRIGLPEDVASATCFLLSDQASFITGVTLTVDGGMDMRG